MAVAAAALIMLAGCSADTGEPSTPPEPSGSTTASASTSLASPTSSVDSASAGAEQIQGEWVSDAGDLFSANTANLGDAAPLSCSGPITLTFRADGTFRHKGRATCTVGSQSATGTLSSTGRYSVSGDQLTFTDSRTTGVLELPGASIPFPDAMQEGTATFRVLGDTLTISFSDPSVGDVTQTWTRA